MDAENQPSSATEAIISLVCEHTGSPTANCYKRQSEWTLLFRVGDFKRFIDEGVLLPGVGTLILIKSIVL